MPTSTFKLLSSSINAMKSLSFSSLRFSKYWVDEDNATSNELSLDFNITKLGLFIARLGFLYQILICFNFLSHLCFRKLKNSNSNCNLANTFAINRFWILVIKSSSFFWILKLTINNRLPILFQNNLIWIDRMEVDMNNLRELGIKAKSKVELYRILTVEGHLFLPPYRCCPADFMAMIATGEKEVTCFYFHYWSSH